MAITKASITVPKIPTKPVTNINNQLSADEATELVRVQNELVDKVNEFDGVDPEEPTSDLTERQLLRQKNALANPTPIATSYEIQDTDDGKTFNTTANNVEYTIAVLTDDFSCVINNNTGIESVITTSSESFDVGDGELGLITRMNSILKVNV